MPLFQAIAAMSENRVIGHQGKIPWHIPEDFRWFKHKTMGATLIMGRKTFESIGKPLPGRKTVIFSRSPRTFIGATTYPDLETFVANEPTSIPVWLCGGAEIYQQLMPKCSVLYLTRVKRHAEGNVLFPAFEDAFELNQVIHETATFRVERWFRQGEPFAPPEAWPFN